MSMIENNFTGSLQNTSISGTYPNYYYNSSVLPAGTYRYRFVANDSAGNSNATSVQYFTITSVIIGKGRDAYQMETDTSNISGYIDSQSTSASIASGWHHTVLVYDGSVIKLYVDGVLKDSKQFTGPINSSANNLLIGNGFNSTIDNVKVYSRALSADEVNWDYQATKDDYAGNYFFNNNTNDQVLYATKNLKDKSTYNFTSNVSSTSSNELNDITHTYVFNSTTNSNFMFALGYTSSINTTNFDANSEQLGFSNEFLETIANSTMTYYDFNVTNPWSRSQITNGAQHTAGLSFNYNSTYIDEFGIIWPRPLAPFEVELVAAPPTDALVELLLQPSGRWT